MLKCTDQCFSKGTDYYGISETYSKQTDPDHRYLTQLYQFLYSVGKLENPLVTVMDGKCYGSAASLAMLGHFPLTTPNTNVCFPETRFGYIPTGGATYFLSRMPDHIGLYLALTGNRLLGADLCHLNLATSHIQWSPNIDYQFASGVNNMPDRMGSRRMFGDQWAMHQEAKITNSYANMVGDLQEVMNRINAGKQQEHWTKHRENTRMVIADVLYKRKIEEMANEKGVKEYRDFRGQTIVNHLLNFEAQCLTPIERSVKTNFSLEQYRGPILRCFSAPTLEELFDRLQYEKTHGMKDWAEFTLQQIQSCSPLATAVTFKLIREAADLQWYECLQREFSAAVNLASHPDFHTGVLTRLGANKQPEWQVQHPVAPDLIAQVCSAHPLALGSKHNEFLPTRTYFRKIPAAPRLWLNELSTNLPYLREDYEFDVKTFLHDLDIDLRNAAIKPEVVRRLLFNYYSVDAQITKEISRIQAACTDPVSVRAFVHHREAAIKQYFSSPEAQSRILTLLTQTFHASFTERLDTVAAKSEEAQRSAKNAFFRELKEFLVSQRFISTQEDEVGKLMMAELENDLQLPMKFPTDNSKSFLDELTSKVQAPAPVLDFYSVLDYKAYLYSGSTPYERKEELVAALKEILAEIGRHLTDTINHCYSRLDPDYDESEDLLEQKVTLGNLLETIKLRDEQEDEDEEEEDEEKDEGTEPFPFETNMKSQPEPKMKEAPEPAQLPELLAELYVKFGEISPAEAARQLAQGYVPDLAGMKSRRRQLLNMQLEMDMKVPHPNSRAFKIKKLFSELFVEPDDTEVDDVLAGKLEVESAREYVDIVRDQRAFRKARLRPLDETSDSEDEGDDLLEHDEEDSEEEGEDEDSITKIVTDVPHSVQLDTMYLETTMGDRAFMPANLTDCITTAPEELTSLGNLTELPAQWLARNLQVLVKGLLKYRGQIETHLTRTELISFDNHFFQIFTPESFQEALLQRLYNEEAFMTNTGIKAREAYIAQEHEKAQNLKSPYLKPQPRPVIAESEAIRHALRLKKEREYLKPKTPLQFTVQDELDFSQVPDTEVRQPVSRLTVQEEYAEHKAARDKLRAKEAKLLEAQKTIAVLQELVQQQKYRKQLKDPAAVEAYLKARQQTLA